MSKIDWTRARKVGAREDYRGSCVVLKDGTRTATVRPDTLGKRADRAMKQWLKRNRKAREEFGP